MSRLWLYWPLYVDLCVECALIGNLLVNGLYRVYRCFFTYLAADAAETAMGALFQANPRLYGEIYFAGQSLKTVVAVLVVLEVYELALESHPALARFGRTVVIYVLTGAAAVATLAIAIDHSVPVGRSPAIHRFNTFERTMDLWMLLFLAVLAVFMAWFPVTLKRNSVLYIGGFAVYFLSRSMGLLLRNVTPQFKHSIDNAMLIASILCLAVWLFALTRKGEEIMTVTGHRWRPGEAKRLAGQLDAINSKLLSMYRR